MFIIFVKILIDSFVFVDVVFLVCTYFLSTYNRENTSIKKKFRVCCSPYVFTFIFIS